MLTLLAAAVTVLTWGSWIPLTHRVPYSSSHVRVFYLAIANLILAFVIARFSPQWEMLTGRVFFFSFLGGLIWSASGACAFYASRGIGIAKANGIWAPLNILLSIFWGIILFGEFLDLPRFKQFLALGAVVLIITGILRIITATETKSTKASGGFLPYLGALGAGILWGTYFVPIRLSDVSLMVAAFPLALGIFTGALLFILTGRIDIRLPHKKDYLLSMTSGILWGIGNYTSLGLMALIGTGKGFTIAQLALIMNALISVFLFKEPKPGSKDAYKTFLGIIIALAGAILLGNLNPGG